MSPAEWEKKKAWIAEQVKLAGAVYDQLCAAQRAHRRDPEGVDVDMCIRSARSHVIPLATALKRAPL